MWLDTRPTPAVWLYVSHIRRGLASSGPNVPVSPGYLSTVINHHYYMTFEIMGTQIQLNCKFDLEIASV